MGKSIYASALWPYSIVQREGRRGYSCLCIHLQNHLNSNYKMAAQHANDYSLPRAFCVAATPAIMLLLVWIGRFAGADELQELVLCIPALAFCVAFGIPQ